MLLQAMGFQTYNARDYHSLTDVRDNLKHNSTYINNKVDYVELKHFKVGLYFIGVAYGFGVMVLIIEVIVYEAITKAKEKEDKKQTKTDVECSAQNEHKAGDSVIEMESEAKSECTDDENKGEMEGVAENEYKADDNRKKMEGTPEDESKTDDDRKQIKDECKAGADVTSEPEEELEARISKMLVDVEINHDVVNK